MARSKAVALDTVAALGAERLAALVLEMAEADPAAMRRVRLALAAAKGPAEAAHAIRKRLATIARSRSQVYDEKVRALCDDLAQQRAAILRDVAPADPAEALELLWTFLDLARPVCDRSDLGGDIGYEFSAAVPELAPLAARAGADPADLARRAFALAFDDQHRVFQLLVVELAPALGPAGLDRLDALADAFLAEPPAVSAADERRLLGAQAFAPRDAAKWRKLAAVGALRVAVASARGDVDALIARVPERELRAPRIAVSIAARLLAAGRGGEALAMLDGAATGNALLSEEWAEARLETLEALGRAAEAQAMRWEWFETRFSTHFLREHLRRLPDFEDVEAETRALALVRASPKLHEALAFLIAWPDLAAAAELAAARADALDGDAYELLAPAAEALAARHPLAATLCLRPMIETALDLARASRYRHAARHLLECRSLARQVADWRGQPAHDAWEAGLRAKHGRKTAFWTLLP
ncbi:DUF6880 family protein [Amaricoccus sp.]|uniref:DUF6880 family protein n=1 Tax=Amaricoccus sp. TaxID=1872485 RepID=UPI001B485ACA|nr:DUF6880 family protein [Amaricoccus sp.]MBP7000831.1 hypothetical protein [Amaricoccus sp.]